MIQRLAHSNLAFKANENSSARESYDSLLIKNNQTAQKQNKTVVNFANQIPMQGAGQKLDIIA